MNDLFSLKNKIIVITGAVGLLGRQHADIVAQAGGIPILLDINETSIQQLTKELNEKYNILCSGFAIDITNEQDIEANCKYLIEKYGHIDGLINNAANNPKMEKSSEKNFSRLENFPSLVWDKDLAVGLKGAFFCSKHYGFAIARQGGSIINISSDFRN
jgi:NAD(P)-dependent dehydrogenase (short-subunit alcohol dehydrogenase family)